RPDLGVAGAVVGELEVAGADRVRAGVAGGREQAGEVDLVAGVEVGDAAAGPGRRTIDEGVVPSAALRPVAAPAEVEHIVPGPAVEVVAGVVGVEGVAGVVAVDRLLRAGQGDVGDAVRRGVGGRAGGDRRAAAAGSPARTAARPARTRHRDHIALPLQ